jgi:hypothetical protein
MFIEDFYGVACAGKFRAAHGTGRTAADNCNFCHEVFSLT